MRIYRYMAYAIALTTLLGGGAAAQPKQKEAKLPEGVSKQVDLDYVGDDLERHRLDLFMPKSAKPLPLVIWIHGGAWQAGGKANPPAFFLLEKGFAVASINYRLSQGAKFPAQIEDCKAAVRYLRGNAKKYNLDPAAFGAWGSSAGGHLVALLGTSGDVKDLEGRLGEHTKESSRVQAVCDWFGPTDFTKMRPVDKLGHPEANLVGGMLQEKMDLVRAANPITHVSKDDPPFLIMHGEKDATVPINQSELLNEALKKEGVDVTFVPLKDAGHGPGFQTPEVRKQVEAFFVKHLKK